MSRVVRVVALIFMIGILPRIVFAIPDRSTLCIANDHVTVNCHDSEDESICDQQFDSMTPDSPLEVKSDANCVDLYTIPIDTTFSRTSTGSEIVKDLTLFLVVLVGFVEDIPSAVSSFRACEELPHSFCARTFCSCIALRC